MGLSNAHPGSARDDEPLEVSPAAGGASEVRRGAGRSRDDEAIVDVEGRVVAEVPALRIALDRGAFHGLVGTSPAMRRVFEKIVLYGRAQAHVLITGETGTGKELVARALHLESERAGGPFVALNCSALNEELFESELFGHERGSFTGASRSHRGRFERADGGSLFLDEIGDMPARMQAKLLRVLEEGAFERVGGEVEIPTDVRIFAATNVPLRQRAELGAFRADLYHRIAVLHIAMPPLRERLEDLPGLVRHFLEALDRRYRRHVRGVTPDALRILQDYDWQGNVRELRNVLERIYVETAGEMIGARALQEWVIERDAFAPGSWDVHRLIDRDSSRGVINMPMSGGVLSGGPGGASLPPAGLLPAPERHPSHELEVRGRLVERPRRGRGRPSRRPHHLEREQILDAFRRADGNATRAAEILGCHKTTLYRALQRFGIVPEELRDEGSEGPDEVRGADPEE